MNDSARTLNALARHGCPASFAAPKADVRCLALSFIGLDGLDGMGGLRNVSKETFWHRRPSRDDAAALVTSSLCPTQQSPANHEQIRQRRGGFQAMQVLWQTAVADLVWVLLRWRDPEEESRVSRIKAPRAGAGGRQ